MFERFWETILKKPEPVKVDIVEDFPTKQCSECYCFIDLRARRCPYCTTVLIA